MSTYTFYREELGPENSEVPVHKRPEEGPGMPPGNPGFVNLPERDSMNPSSAKVIPTEMKETLRDQLTYQASVQRVAARARTAATMGDILGKTGPLVHQRSQGLQVRQKRFNPARGFWTFSVTGSRGKVYTVRLKGIRKTKALRALKKATVKCSCSCPFWRWQGPEHWGKVNGFLYGRPRGTASKPVIRDPKEKHWACKHILAAMNQASTYRFASESEAWSLDGEVVPMLDPSADRVAALYLHHAGVSQLPNVVDASIVKKLQTDMRRLTKIYRSIQTKMEWDGTEYRAVDTGWGEKWEEGRKLVNEVRRGLESWVYGVLLQHGTKDTKWWQETLRETAWEFLAHITSLFPDAWDYKTDTHKRSLSQLEQARETNIRRYQKSFREFMESLSEFIEYEGGGDSVVRRPESEAHPIGKMNVIIHNVGRGAPGEEGRIDPRAFLQDLARQASVIERAGFPEAVAGLTVHMRFDRSDLTAGQYNAAKDELTMFPLGMFAGKLATTFTHEVGHRFYYRDLSTQARLHWVETMGGRSAEIKRDDIEDFYKKYLLSGKIDKYEAQRESLSKIDEANPVDAAKFRYLAEHNPSYEGEWPQMALDHHIKFNIGEKVSLEFITDYGATSPVEAFAEAFQLYVLKGPRRLGPWTRWFFREISRSGGARLATSPNANRVAASELLSAAKSVRDLPEGSRIEVQSHPVGSYVVITAGSETLGEMWIQLRNPKCEGADLVAGVEAKGGWGPLFYDIAMELSGKRGITPDRHNVTSRAEAVWDHYLIQRSDVVSEPLGLGCRQHPSDRASLNYKFFARSPRVLNALRQRGMLFE